MTDPSPASKEHLPPTGALGPNGSDGADGSLSAAAEAAHRPGSRAAERTVKASGTLEQPLAAIPELPAEDELPRGRRFLLFNAVPSWLISMLLHALVLLALGLMTLNAEQREVHELLAVGDQGTEEIAQFELNEMEALDVETFDSAPPTPSEADLLVETPEVAVVEDLSSAAAAIELSEFSDEVAPQSDLLAEVASLTGAAFEGRGGDVRSMMVQKYGGNAASEKAVALALQWLARHQLADGGWSYNHALGECQGRCSHAGDLANARNAATAMALLPFLGAGQTHQQGAYKKNVEAGLLFLTRNIKIRNGMGSFWEPGGRMYSHGLCAITMCEAYGMTHDQALMSPAQLSLNYIVYAQDPVGGGWRYDPKQPGDTSVVGWQLMALKSGHLAFLQVPGNTIIGASNFLDYVQADGGARYGYNKPGTGDATSAIGLLCRMYLGWKKDNPALQKGIKFLADTGPSSGNMYYNYYATQVLRHYGGQEWEKWNDVMRDQLINTQAQEGHAAGSWYMNDPHIEKGGRLYCTSMATMILEVYYRHMPIYGQEAAEEDFPL